MEVIQILKENLNDQNKFLKEHNIVFRKYSKESSMILKIKGRDNDNESDSWTRFCRGFIYNLSDMSVLSVPPVKSNELTKEEFFSKELGEKNVIQELVDGTMINMYYHNDKWNLSTRSSIGCNNKWDNNKSFHELFKECGQILEEYMDKELNYSFVLRHKENRIITPITRNELILVEVHRGAENIPLMDCRKVVEEMCETNGLKDLGFTFVRQFKTNNYEDLDKLFHLADNILVKGFTIKDYDLNTRYKWISPSYKYLEELKINTNNKCMGYLSLRKNGNLKNYLSYFPEDRHQFNEYRELFRTIVDKLFNSYQSAFVHKTLEKKDVDYALKPLMYELHKTYLDTKKPTTYNMVKEYFHNLPVKKIQFVMNYY